MNKKVNQSFRRYDRKNENYLKDFFNNSSTSLEIRYTLLLRHDDAKMTQKMTQKNRGVDL
jgi:hypothetical protein